MNFQRMQKIEEYQIYLDRAFTAAKKNAARLKQKKPKLKGSEARGKHAQYMEIERCKEVIDNLTTNLRSVHEKFPGLDALPPFYNTLARITMRYNYTKKALGAIHWAEKQCREVGKKIIIDVKRARSFEEIQKIRKQFYGRISSIMKQIKDAFAIIEESRRVMKTWPDIKTEVRTIAIGGYPNVGKSSLLKALTTAKPDIQAYAFTTKSLNIGYMEQEPKVYQIVDTPGTFDRDIEKMNNVEKQAYAVLQHIAEKIVYIFDPSESCGYEVEQQLLLAKRIENNFKKPIFFIANKVDLDTAKLQLIKKQYPEVIELSLKTKKGIEEVKKRITKELK